MIKAIGGAMLLFACAGMGFYIAQGYRNRTNHLRALIRGVRLLKTEIEYRVMPLPQALANVAEKTTPPINEFFLTAASQLQNPGVGVVDAFSEGVEVCRRNSSLHSPELEVILEFGKTLGSSDRLHQSELITATLVHLEELASDAREDQTKNERLWQSLGVLFGILLLILIY